MSTTEHMTATEATRSVLHRYEHDLYNARNVDLVDELLAEPMFRHDAGGAVTEMSRADCRERIGGFFRDYADLTFRTIHQIIDGPLASWTYELTLTDHDGNQAVISSIEIFEVLDQTAAVKLTAFWGIDYMHLAKYDGEWKIVQVLWQSAPMDE